MSVPLAPRRARSRGGEDVPQVAYGSFTVVDWTLRYFGPWWNAFEVPAEGVCAAPLVTADVDEKAYTDLAALVTACPHDEVTYARTRLLLTRDSTGTICGVSPEEGLAYRSEQLGGHVTRGPSLNPNRTTCGALLRVTGRPRTSWSRERRSSSYVRLSAVPWPVPVTVGELCPVPA